MDQLTQVVQGVVTANEAKATDIQQLDGEGLAASFGEGKKTGAVIAGVVGLGKLDRFLRNLDKTTSAGYVTPKGNFSKLDDPADTFRHQDSPEILRADQDHPQQTGSFVNSDGENNPVYEIQSGEQANQPGQERHCNNYIPEHVPNRSVVTTDFPTQTEMVHVFNIGTGKTIDEAMIGNWTMPKSEILRPDGTMMSAVEIQQKFSLSAPPTHIVNVVPDRPVQATVSSTAGHTPHGGAITDMPTEGGGQQWRILEDKEDLPTDWFQDPRPIGER